MGLNLRDSPVHPVCRPLSARTSHRVAYFWMFVICFEFRLLIPYSRLPTQRSLNYTLIPQSLPRRAHECSFLAIVWHVTIRRARLPPRYIRPKSRSKFAPPGPKRRSYWAWCVFSALSPRPAAESSFFSSEVRILPWFNTQSPRFARRKLIS